MTAARSGRLELVCAASSEWSVLSSSIMVTRTKKQTSHKETYMKRMRPISCSRLVLTIGLVFGLLLTTAIHVASASTDDDRRTVAALDSEYQAAVKRNDAPTMARILADDFVLVTGSGKTYTKTDMLEDARRGDLYLQNDEENQTVRVWGDTAVVTAKLWEKYTSNGKSFDHKFWFSDTYVRTRAGWKYVFGQSSLPLLTSAQ
jgi:ketosteroid isomerase-like protein